MLYSPFRTFIYPYLNCNFGPRMAAANTWLYRASPIVIFTYRTAKPEKKIVGQCEMWIVDIFKEILLWT